MPRVIPLLVLLLLSLHGTVAFATSPPAADTARATLLVIFADPPDLRATLASLSADENAATPDGRRLAISRARHAAHGALMAAHGAELSAALPAAVRAQAAFEAQPILGAALVHVPQAQVGAAHAALQAQAARRGSAIAALALQPYGPPARMQIPASATLAVAPDAQPGAIDIALIDNGADARHPLLGRALGRLTFGPDTPGADGRLLRSHGTAMLGIYALLARGGRLVASGVPQRIGFEVAPFPLASALVLRAGPETAAGRNQLVRDLAWLIAPDGARSFPDIINYSQGNGALCADWRERPCRGTRWHGVTRLLDRIADEQDIVVVKSAGNYGHAVGASMTVPGDTYNGITVGNMHAFDTASCRPSAVRRTHRLYRTSSVGPVTGSGPRLLDLVAPGVRIRTTGVDPAWCHARCASDTSTACSFCPRLGRRADDEAGYWKTNSGTSPAAAVVGATAAGLMHAGTRPALLIKAILVNSADTWQSGDTPAPRVKGDGRGCAGADGTDAHGPYAYGAHYDRSYGWGYLNPAAAMRERRHARLDTLTAGAAVCYHSTLSPWDKLSLAWNRHVVFCDSCTPRGWQALNALDVSLHDAAAPERVIDRDRLRRADDNLLQVSNGRGAGATPHTQNVIVRVRAPATMPGVETYALASRRPLTRMEECPAALR